MVEGIEEAGEVLGAAAVMPVTGAEEDEVNLPTNDVVTDEWLSIGKIGLDTAVYEARDIAGAYLVGDKEVARIENETGVVLYGHNTEDVFGKLTWMSIGDTVEYGERGQEQTYKLSYISYLSDTNTTVLEDNGRPGTLTLITCAPWNENIRIVLEFELAE